MSLASPRPSPTRYSMLGGGRGRGARCQDWFRRRPCHGRERDTSTVPAPPPPAVSPASPSVAPLRLAEAAGSCSTRGMACGGAGGCPMVLLRSGRSVPVLGLGTSHRGGYSHDAVVHALRQCGIRHIDTAKRYGCESLLQKAIKESGVKREDLWITTKLWHSDYGYENTKKACLESCERLGVEYLGMHF
uniref:NADP-dependent oxidoreductase domain-containing protein n=1 Tax=Pavo cristatus TaxID=9049 RepID=A0A8C9FB28_PAVCR